MGHFLLSILLAPQGAYRIHYEDCLGDPNTTEKQVRSVSSLDPNDKRVLKVLRDNCLYILYDDKVYSIFGHEIK